MPYSDRSENEYRSSFKANFSQILFELAMFSFINGHKTFKKMEQERSKMSQGGSDKPDLIFQENDEIHYIECTTNTSSLFDKFIKLKRRFDDYLKAAAVLYESFKKTQEIYHNRKNTPLYSSAMLNVVYELNFYERNFFIECMSRSMNSKIKISLEEAVKLFLEYTKIIRYACFYHKEFIDTSMLDELKKIEFPVNMHLCDETDSALMKEFLARSLARSIVDKARKDYFKKKIPITLAVSFALRKEFTLHFLVHEQLIPYLKENLTFCIQEELSKEKDDQIRSELKEAIKNLYSIIIDTTWYNWMPDIVEARPCGSFKDENKNCYICIYNGNHPMVKDGRKIYTNINSKNVYIHEISAGESTQEIVIP